MNPTDNEYFFNKFEEMLNSISKMGNFTFNDNLTIDKNTYYEDIHIKKGENNNSTFNNIYKSALQYILEDIFSKNKSNWKISDSCIRSKGTLQKYYFYSESKDEFISCTLNTDSCNYLYIGNAHYNYQFTFYMSTFQQLFHPFLISCFEILNAAVDENIRFKNKIGISDYELVLDKEFIYFFYDLIQHWNEMQLEDFIDYQETLNQDLKNIIALNVHYAKLSLKNSIDKHRRAISGYRKTLKNKEICKIIRKSNPDPDEKFHLFIKESNNLIKE